MFKRLFSLPKRLLKVKKRYLIIGGILLLFLVLFLSRRGSSKQPLQFATVKREDLRQLVSASGTISGKNSVNLKFKSGGKLAFVNVKLGDQVTKGELIATLDAQDLLSSLGQAQNNLRSAQNTLDKTLDDIHLFQYGNGGFSNVGTPNETQTQKQSRTSAEVARDNANEAVKSAQDAISNAALFSPIDGIVVAEPPISGLVVGASDTIAQITDFSSKVFAADVDESDIGKVSIGQRAEFTLNSFGDRTFYGTVTEVVPATHTTSSGATVVTVKVSADDPSIKPIAGLNGQVNIILEERKNVLSIPNDAIRDDNTVFIQTQNGTRSQKVKVLFKTDSDSEIEGLSEGEKVVTNPSIIPTNAASGRNPLFRIVGGILPRGARSGGPR